MHPSRAIRGGRSELLRGRRIVLGVSGSIAAIEAPRVARELLRHGAEVRVVMSPEATRILTPEAVTFATGHPPVLQLTGEVEHVTLLGPGEGRADLLLIAPATANTLSKIAHGIDDTPVTSCASVALGGGVPVLVAPAMHAHMGRNPAVQESLARLQRWGVGVIAPVESEGEEKLATPEEIAAAVLHRLASGAWAGRRVLVIGGASREPLDDVRSLTNESSGATAVAIAVQAHYRGAETELWMGAAQVPLPGFLAVRRWRGVRDLPAMLRRSRASDRPFDAVLVPAALSDFVVEARDGKLSSRDHPKLTVKLTRAPKLLPLLRRFAPAPCRLVGFRLESGGPPSELEASARRLMDEASADWVVANDRASMGSAETTVLVLTRSGDRRWLRGPKPVVAGKLLDDLGRELEPPPARARGSRARPGRRPAARAAAGTRARGPSRSGARAAPVRS